MIAEGPALAQLLPQRPPFVMIGQLESATEGCTVSRYQVSAASVLFADGVFTEAGLIENIAQTAAAGVGFSYQQQQKPAPIGYIAAVKDLRIHKLPAEGTELTTEVVVKNQVLDFTIIQGLVRAGDTTLAECEMRIFVKE
ncbi:3-hydroxyacyl-ACP dehydratase [Hymenobacter sp. ASUV-10]|uniref:3-hydroxyacyl-ACP dehydratase n=1 Tax=Hymenobacter aranciens TaxID=3063996 RepID=A0ABT9BGM8_9BACT|nr:3-hydroxyacyl-ACP dehydratase [Hymenobacter sp. ASUV-10]MDO7875801.1 3-hydroxyacyl-ACP dehydratase [Hymenobacter sp. ASUV-10]